jgi:hypothetical protein
LVGDLDLLVKELCTDLAEELLLLFLVDAEDDVLFFGAMFAAIQVKYS